MTCAGSPCACASPWRGPRLTAVHLAAMRRVETSPLPRTQYWIVVGAGVPPKDDSETALGSSEVSEVQGARVRRRETVSVLPDAGPVFSAFALHGPTMYVSSPFA